MTVDLEWTPTKPVKIDPPDPALRHPAPIWSLLPAFKYSPDQPRDERGRFGDGSGGSSASAPPSTRTSPSGKPAGPRVGKKMTKDDVSQLYKKFMAEEPYSYARLVRDAENADPRAAHLGKTGHEQGDDFLYAIAKEQGFDALPQVVTEADLDAAIAGGDIELWRGVQREYYIERFVDGEYHAGNGMYGNGTYAASVYAWAEDYAGERYADPKNPATSPFVRDASGEPERLVMRMALSKDAKILDANSAGFNSGGADRAVAPYSRSDDEGVQEVRKDVGRSAAASGYDAMKVTDNYYVIFNRGALKVEEWPPKLEDSP